MLEKGFPSASLRPVQRVCPCVCVCACAWAYCQLFDVQYVCVDLFCTFSCLSLSF